MIKRSSRRLSRRASSLVAVASKRLGINNTDTPEACAFDLFISHRQANGGSQCLYLHTVLQDRYGIRAWLDMSADDLSTKGMVSGIQQSHNLLIFVTDGIFEREFCLMEIREARKANKPIFAMYERDDRHGGGTVANLLKQVPAEFSFLRDDEWIEFNPRAGYLEAGVEWLLKRCNLTAANGAVAQLFEDECKRRKTGPLHVVNQYEVGTREWVFDGIRTWYEGEEWSQVFCLVAVAGVGKSVVAGQLVVHGSADFASEAKQILKKAKLTAPAAPVMSIGAYHFFKHDGMKRSSARNGLLSVCGQLRQSVPGFREALEQDQLCVDDLRKNWTLLELFQRVICDPATSLKREDGDNNRVLVVFDALDECVDVVEFVRIIEHEWRVHAPSWLGVLVTAKPVRFSAGPTTSSSSSSSSTTNQPSAEGGSTLLNIEDKRNGKDLENFLRAKLAGKTCEGETDEVVKALLDRSQGLFLYMKFLDQMIEETVDSKAKNSKLALASLDSHFPKGLAGMFALQFGKLHKEIGHDSYHNLLSTVTAARSPLPLALWIRGHGLPVTGTGTRKDKELMRQFAHVERKCRNLLYAEPDILDQGMGTIRFVHKSMADWLTGDHSDELPNALNSGNELLHVSPYVPGHDVLANECLTLVSHKKSHAITRDRVNWQNASSALTGPLPKLPAGRRRIPIASDAVMYAVRHAVYHLSVAERFEDIEPIVFDLDKLMQRIEVDRGTTTLLVDLEKYFFPELDDGMVGDYELKTRTRRVGSVGVEVGSDCGGGLLVDDDVFAFDDAEEEALAAESDAIDQQQQRFALPASESGVGDELVLLGAQLKVLMAALRASHEVLASDPGALAAQLLVRIDRKNLSESHVLLKRLMNQCNEWSVTKIDRLIVH
jgi:hypothetical protein